MWAQKEVIKESLWILFLIGIAIIFVKLTVHLR
jgi:hypothetical protein